MVITEGYLKEKLTKELDAVHVVSRSVKNFSLRVRVYDFGFPRIHHRICANITYNTASDAMTKRADPDKFTVTKHLLLPGLFFALFLRWCVAAYPYSGYNTPPMYGDYEAQRHWQEITVHTPMMYWYHNTTQNDLQYWGLDYPPLSAFHSYLIGIVADWMDPESVRLFASRGYEKDSHKTFMRWTVFLSDIYFFFSAVLCLCIDLERIKPKDDTNVFKRTDIATILTLLYPGIILIDHGHFQYNCVSLGLFLWGVFFIVAIEVDILATFFFCLALNYKQMELYHALPFFFYLLRNCFVDMPLYKGKLAHLAKQFYKLVVVVLTTFIIVWYRFATTWKFFSQVIYRLFPLKRGVFEDKVSNVWCFVNVFIKLKTILSNEDMAKLCLSITTLAVLPSCMDLFFRCNRKKFTLSLINVSLAFFLFSFQVHEKSILLVSIPVSLHLPFDPFMCFWFLLVSNFSMLPLLLKDGLLIPFIATNLIYISAYSIAMKIAQPCAGILSFFNASRVYKIVKPGQKSSVLLKLVSFNFFLSVIGMICLTIASVLVVPPPKYPDLFPMLVSVYSCSHFLLFFLYFNHQQFSIPAFIKPKMPKLKKK